MCAYIQRERERFNKIPRLNCMPYINKQNDCKKTKAYIPFYTSTQFQGLSPMSLTSSRNATSDLPPIIPHLLK